jgi:plastocyanin
MTLRRPSTKTLPWGAAMLAATAAGIGLGVVPHADAAGATKKVHIVDIDFSPKLLKVKRGTTVTWSFEDENTPHNVTSRGKTKFRSSPTKQSGTYSVRFTKPGTYAYVCTIHFNMKARVVVS